MFMVQACCAWGHQNITTKPPTAPFRNNTPAAARDVLCNSAAARFFMASDIDNDMDARIVFQQPSMENQYSAGEKR